jgi:very-short-patch-repair endonuclease
MRHTPTAAEARLFQVIRGNRLVPLLGRFIVELYAPQVRFIVEVDGGYHVERAAGDARRDRAPVEAGYPVLHLDAQLETARSAPRSSRAFGEATGALLVGRVRLRGRRTAS